MNADALLSPILVADDDATDVFFLERRLRAAGVQEPVQHVGDGLEAVEWLQRLTLDQTEGARPWAMFLDLKMPRMSGLEVLAWMHARQLTDDMAVAVLSTSDDPRDIQRAQQLGAVRFLMKYPQPYDLGEVIELARRRALDRAATGVTRFGVAMD